MLIISKITVYILADTDILPVDSRYGGKVHRSLEDALDEILEAFHGWRN